MARRVALSRRDFLKLTAVGAGAMAVSGCLWGSQQTQVTPASPNSILYQKTPPSPPGGVPDLIIHNAKILTVDASDSIAEAVAVKSGRIQAVGTNDIIVPQADGSTRMMDLGGKVLTPGLIDPHFHLAVISLMNSWEAFPLEIDTIEALVEGLTVVAAEYEPGEWIQGYFESGFGNGLPDRYDLDEATSQHPIFISHRGGHLGVANSMALDLAQIGQNYESPMGGIIELDDDGVPTGRFYNHRAMNVLRAAIPARSNDNLLNDIRDQSVPASVGITTFHDVYVHDPNTIAAYYSVGRAGEMTVRGALYPTLENPGEVPYALDLAPYQDDYFRLGGFKLQIDGQIPTAYTYEPHVGVSWNMPAWDADIFKETVRQLHEAEHQICVHCFGDAAIDLTLDAFEEAMDAHPRSDPRHRIEHYLVPTEEAIQRTRDLGIIASVSSSFIPQAGEAYIATFGDRRCERLLPARSLLDAGAVVTLNSDYPTTYWAAPMMAMSAAMQRISNMGNPISIEQAITFTEALRAHTLAPAFAGFEETEKGSVEAGKLADFAVWTNDPTAMSAAELAEATVDTTIVGGEVVYQA
ncbi:MAG TPA: amidohydrolase family protein [Longilinea sp.]|nr:amidohydrolase family protein [Longilinea sp.]